MGDMTTGQAVTVISPVSRRTGPSSSLASTKRRPRSSVSTFANRSTIYRRNERRLARTYALRDDPRSAPIRVLSGLPVFNTLFPPYVPEEGGQGLGDGTIVEKNKQPNNTSLLSSLTSSSLPRFDGTVTAFDDETIWAREGGGGPTPGSTVSSIGTSAGVASLPSIFVAGCLGGAAEALLGRSKTNDVLQRIHRQIGGAPRHPFGAQMGQPPIAAMMDASSSGGLLSLGGGHSASAVEGTALSGRAAGGPLLRGGNPRSFVSSYSSAIADRILPHALSAGVLFGSNAYFRRILEGNGDEKKEGSGPLSKPFVMSSILTGLTTATLFAPFELARARTTLHATASTGGNVVSPFFPFVSRVAAPSFSSSPPSSSLSVQSTLRELSSILRSNQGNVSSLYRAGGKEIYARDVLGYVAYFSTYEIIKSYLMVDRVRYPNDPTPDGIAIALAGGIAGASYWSLVYPLDTLKSMIQQVELHNSSLSRSSPNAAMRLVQEVGISNLYRGYLTCVARAIPANAVLFWGYETARGMIVGGGGGGDGSTSSR